ncbi:MAG: bifunctional (p)ppGpp synthetase/guanosine-3',5'-bis(diphosphate) 3'-pyrophosphohydrolase [Flavobacteriales bacterium]|nr:bifunctional (p)ppGpp synthetase/guanosine-3',5'-bis(diphosphate) 3'-pyrophosphohydrolase [Flavobacteriales bacterium]
MSTPSIDLEAEKKEILRRYRGLLRAAVHSKSVSDRRAIRKAFDIALDAHKDMRRKSGEPYIYHPISVARVVAEELSLDTTAIVCALLHDTVEDTYLTLEDVEQLFGQRERNIVDGLTKMSGVFDPGTSAQAENFRKMLLTLSDDVRVILIKLADRLDNMRTLDHMRPDKQQKIASETLFMYAPLAHRLGLYNIKTELEDLSLKYKEPEDYEVIESKLRKTKAVRTRFINAFTTPIRRALEANGIKHEVRGRPKSIYSIWSKMQKQRVAFEEVYDVFAIRIILDSPIEQEKANAWQTYSIVSDFYQPNPDRLRDWISLPKANGYESLHTTVMSPSGKWVEVQIRSRRMDEIAEKGLAAHWQYKNTSGKNAGNASGRAGNLDNWLVQIREMLESGEEDALQFIDEFKLNLQDEEIFVFTPNGDLFSLPKGATTLDFAFRVHTQIGSRCIGAKVNHKLVPLSHVLTSGDQVEIITSRKQKPKEDWLNYVVTASARSKIRSVLRDEERAIAQDGKEKLRKWMRRKELEFTPTNIESLVKRLKHDSPHALLMRIATGELKLDRLGGYSVEKGKFKWIRAQTLLPNAVEKPTTAAKSPEKGDVLLIGEGMQKLEYGLATCCNPIPGDSVFGFVMVSGGIKVHRQNCSNATNLLSKYAYRVMKAQWTSRTAQQFEVTLNFTGIDDVGLVNAVTNVISADMNVNMRAISFNSSDGTFEGRVKVLVTDTSHLKQVQAKLLDVPGVWTVDRADEG